MTACQSLSFGTVSLTRRSSGLKIFHYLPSVFRSWSFVRLISLRLYICPLGSPMLLMCQYLCLVVFYFLFYFEA